MDAIGVATVSIGGFLLYASIRGLHPWDLFKKTLGASAPQAPPTNLVGGPVVPLNPAANTGGLIGGGNAIRPGTAG
jgi:hypothetical protein